MLIIFILFVIGKLTENTSSTTNTADTNTNDSSTAPITTLDNNVYKVGETLKSDMFEITVNKVGIYDRVNAGNEFVNLKPEAGINYIVFNTTFKNIDTESRMLMDGKLTINYNGKDYDFDKSETIMLDGWGLLLDQINPLVSKTTNMVYKVPAELKGDLYWIPGRVDDGQKILLGTLN